MTDENTCKYKTRLYLLKCRLVAAQKKFKRVVVLLTSCPIFAAIRIFFHNYSD